MGLGVAAGVAGALLVAAFAGAIASAVSGIGQEVFNASVIWARRGRDTLAVGNVTGAMAFQAVFPVTIGLLLTPWKLSGEALVAAIVALGAGAILYATLRIRGRLGAWILLLQGAIYAAYVAYLIPRL